MPTIAYLANQFPSPFERYVVNEILALRKHGVEVIPCSAWRSSPGVAPVHKLLERETLSIFQPTWRNVLRASGVLLWNFPLLWEFFARILFKGREAPLRRAKALLHTLAGVHYSLLLAGRGVEHIHVHHGYFSAWIAMVAARLLGIGYSMTLHGSDILLHHAYLDIKLEKCAVCFTVSEYNRKYLLARFPKLDPGKIVLRRLGVDTAVEASPPAPLGLADRLVILSVGRLHPVKNHSFLVEACAKLKREGMHFLCLIAGDGPERKLVKEKIARHGLRSEVKLLGQVEHGDLEALYPMVDLVVLTSRSEGIPVALMEAMVRKCIVLAPAITGIPELVINGKTGFLYSAGSQEDFILKIKEVRQSLPFLDGIREAARARVLVNFDQVTNLQNFIATLLSHVHQQREGHHAHTLLQQIQLRVQRN